jgi:phosphoribosyl 1,2-cyclic phosphodiesterase
MMDLTLLASGSKGNSFVIQDQGTKVMIDCGTTKKHLIEGLHKLHLEINDLDALLITHDHSDHISQIRHFKDLDIYSPVEISDIDTFRVRPLQKFTINNLTFTPIALSHDALNTTGYIIEDGIEKLVYVTDTGYVNQRYIPMMKDADWIILESNHDVDMLMHTSRPQFLKQRIYGDDGHLNNEDCAQVLKQIVTKNTKMIILAHLSEQANTREKALEVTSEVLLDIEDINENLVVCAAGQYEMIRKGENDEEMDLGSVKRFIGLEHHS